MENKEIYIDGVDVSGCYELFNGCCCDNGSFYCSDQPNCKFKLEKRGYKLEQITEFTPREELIETIVHLRVLNAELESYNEQLKESQDIEIKQNKNLREQLKRKEQECEELKEAQKNSRCAWKSLEGTFCPQAQEQLEAYKMEADEGKEINAELKAENEEWKKANDCILTTLNVIAEGNKKLRQTLTEIKEIAEKRNYLDYNECLDDILQKISEVEDEYNG